MLDSLKPVWIQMEAGTRQYESAIATLTHEQWLTRFGKGTNHAAFLALHLLDARRYLLGLLGHQAEHGFEDLVGPAKKLEDISEYPNPDAILEAWRRMALQVRPTLESATTERLASAPPFQFPVEDATVLGAVSFLSAHEAYHIGQLVIIRRGLGLAGITFV